jgi:hypothetical protein
MTPPIPQDLLLAVGPGLRVQVGPFVGRDDAASLAAYRQPHGGGDGTFVVVATGCAEEPYVSVLAAAAAEAEIVERWPALAEACGWYRLVALAELVREHPELAR